MKMIFAGLLAFGSLTANAERIHIEMVDVVRGAQQFGVEMPISYRSDVNGVCAFLGYDSGIEGTKVAVTEIKTVPVRKNRWDVGGSISSYTVEVESKADALVVDAKGTLVKQVYSRLLSQVKCLKKI